MPGEFHHELEIASKAVQLCAILTNRVQRDTLISPDGSVKKSDYSPVSIADFAVQALLTSGLRGAFHYDAFLAEESADELRHNEPMLQLVWELIESVKPAFREAAIRTPDSKQEAIDLIDLGGKNTRSDGPRTWILDPIDGTATFLRGQQYAINCAFLVDGREELGIIGCPNLEMGSADIHEDSIDKDGLGSMVFATRSQGAWVRPMQSNCTLEASTPIDRHGDNPSVDDLKWCDYSSRTAVIMHLHQQVAEKLGTSWPGVDLYSSLMEYAALGLGKASIVIRIFKFASWRSNMWDHAGGVLIFEETGGKVTDLDGKPIDFSKGRKMAGNYGLVCAPSTVHGQVLKVVQEVVHAYGPIPWDRNSK